jgi:hypothetical protein
MKLVINIIYIYTYMWVYTEFGPHFNLERVNYLVNSFMLQPLFKLYYFNKKRNYAMRKLYAVLRGQLKIVLKGYMIIKFTQYTLLF